MTGNEDLKTQFGEDPDDDPICPRCGCCSQVWHECENCDEGWSGHDCGEDCCCCLNPTDNIRCDICGGKGGWYVCGGGCDDEGKHKECVSSFRSRT